MSPHTAALARLLRDEKEVIIEDWLRELQGSQGVQPTFPRKLDSPKLQAGRFFGWH